MKTLTLYISDDTPGGTTVAEKTYSIIADGFGEAGIGYPGAPGEPDVAANLDMVHKRYKILSATRMTGENEGQWEVVIEGNDFEMEEYEAVLKELE